MSSINSKFPSDKFCKSSNFYPKNLQIDSLFGKKSKKIDKSDENIQEKYNALLTKYPNYQIYYIDSSFKNKESGHAIVTSDYYNKDKLTTVKVEFSQIAANSVDAELLGILMAVEYLQNKDGKFLIFNDSKNGIGMLKKFENSKNVKAREILETIKASKAQFVIAWAPRKLKGIVFADEVSKIARKHGSVLVDNIKDKINFNIILVIFCQYCCLLYFIF
ncbi:hypothetical protein PVAND_002108 [Polypedilum vanderplanki]|uniref:Uncharacterized protein n=1 Tax=Polypedilum vanderplanki TaxID=319348 RepID=A0A9J6BQ00_POLVA|nr:hypothetical protein PVAND_002108 [Polypedilum vanderplanki]